MRPSHAKHHLEDDVTGQFRYNELGDERFQQLIQATLVAERGPGVQCFPLNQTDGGRDIADGNSCVFQVKFSDKPVTRPATWLRQTSTMRAGTSNGLSAGG